MVFSHIIPFCQVIFFMEAHSFPCLYFFSYLCIKVLFQLLNHVIGTMNFHHHKC